MAVPHFVYPFRFAAGRFVTAEQDTVEDVVSCVAVVLLHHPGDRELLPEFGIVDPTFQRGPIDIESVVQAVQKWEPRAVQAMVQQPTLDPMIVQIIDNISMGETLE